MRFAAGTAADTETDTCEIGVAVLEQVRKIGLVKLWKWKPENLPSVIHSIRTAIAATISLAVARLFGLPEAYWAAIATLVVMQSTLGATLLISVERIAATALGALAGALLANYFTGNLLVFAAAVFALGLLCAGFRMEKPRTVTPASRSPSSCSSHVQTPPGSLHFTASSKSRLESSSPWRWRLCGRSTNPRRRRKAPSNWAVVGGRVARDPDFAADTAAPTADWLADANNAWIAEAA